MKKLGLYIRHLAPWCAALGIFVYLFHLYPPAQVWRSLSYVNIPAFVLFALFYFGIIFIADCWVMKYVIGRFSCQTKLTDILKARGATYLIMVLNYPASQAAFAYYFKRRYKIPISDALGIFILIIFVDLMWIITLAFAGSFFQEYVIGGVDLGNLVQKVAIAAYAVAFVWMAFWRRWPERIIGRHFKLPLIERLRRRRTFHIFNQVSPLDYFKIGIMRIPIHFTIIISMYVVVQTFHTFIPFVKILGNIPLAFLIGTLPITPGGLGTSNAVMVELLHPYISGPIFANGQVTPQEILFTVTLLWMFSNAFLKVVMGTFLLKRVSRDLFRPTPGVPEEKAEHEAAHLGGNI
jgi:uncharacterized membrane protein YbhN (UPF0104 family)